MMALKTRRSLPLTPAQQMFADRHIELAQRIARIHARERPGLDSDEVESAAMLGLVAAVRTYDAGKNDSPEKWITYKVGRAFTDLVHRKVGIWGDTRKLRGKVMPAVGGLPEEIEDSHSNFVTGETTSLPIDGAMESHNLGTAARRIGCDRQELLRVICAGRTLPEGVAAVRPDKARRRRWLILPAAIPALHALVLGERRRQLEHARRRVEALEALEMEEPVGVGAED